MSDVAIDFRELLGLIRDLGFKAERVIADAMPIAAEMMVAAVQEQYDTEGEGQWQQLADSTKARRRAEGRGAKILQDTGALAGSTMPAWGDDYAQAYTNIPYAIFHTSDAPRSKIPLRNPFDIDEERVQEEVADIILKAIAA